MTDSIFIGASSGGANPQALELKRANRHGLIAGATGTGKTVTLQTLVEGLSARRRADLHRRREGRSCRASPWPDRPPPSLHEIFAARSAEIGNTALAISRQSRAVLGPVRRTGPPDPHHRQRDGTAAPRAAAGPERSAGRRSRNRLPRRRQGRAAPPRPRRSAGDAAPLRRTRRRTDHHLWQRVEDERRRDPALAAAAAQPGRRAFLR